MVFTVLIAFTILAVTVGLQFKQIEQTRAQARAQTCERISALDRTLVTLIRKGEASLPALAYYKAHPADLALVIKQDETAVRALSAPGYCH
jgi:hypothetical protein